MAIQWFPGHMHKARKEVADAIPIVDVVIEVLDARIPYSSDNPMLDPLRENKPCLKILNKADLADPSFTATWLESMNAQSNTRAIALNSSDHGRIKHLLEDIRQFCPRHADNHKTIHTMIMGIPNVGKSTLINILAGRVIAKTGNEPAITKAQQRINLGNGITLSDTPGMLWPRIENEQSGYRLAVTGAIRETAYDLDDIAYFAMEYVLQRYPGRLAERYNITESGDVIACMEQVGQRRGCLTGGKQVDFNKVSKLVITEIREAKLGAISWETPAMIADELVIVAQQNAERDAKKAARKARRKKS